MKWFKKRQDANAAFAAYHLGCKQAFERIGDVIHIDDLPKVCDVLQVPVTTAVDCLFTPTTLEKELN